MEGKETVPVSVWVQVGDSMTKLTVWEVDPHSGITGMGVMQGLPAVFRTLALQVEQFCDAQ